MLAKLFSEAVERSDPRPVEGVRATGANAVEEILYGVIPQVDAAVDLLCALPPRIERGSASVVGMVGAGGIGVIVRGDPGFEYAQTCAVMIIIIVS